MSCASSSVELPNDRPPSMGVRPCSRPSSPTPAARARRRSGTKTASVATSIAAPDRRVTQPPSGGPAANSMIFYSTGDCCSIRRARIRRLGLPPPGLASPSYTATVTNPYVASLIGLVGAIIGATAGLAGTLLNERRKARHDRRERILSLISDALISGDKNKTMQSKIWIAVAGERSSLRALAGASSPNDILLQLNQVILDIVNSERTSLGLEKLDLRDISNLLVAKEFRESQSS
jgi:hypothetical protein